MPFLSFILEQTPQQTNDTYFQFRISTSMVLKVWGNFACDRRIHTSRYANDQNNTLFNRIQYAMDKKSMS